MCNPMQVVSESNDVVCDQIIKEIPSLNLVPMVPRFNTRLQSLNPYTARVARQRLGQIDSVKIHDIITRKDGITYFILDVYLLHSDARIPSNLRQSFLRQTRNLRPERTEPDYRVEHRFSDFLQLRKEICKYTCRTDGLLSCCDFCTRYSTYLEYKFHQPNGIFMKMTWVLLNYRKKMLAKFVNDFIRMAQNGHKIGRSCPGRLAIPAILAKFVHQVDETQLIMV